MYSLPHDIETTLQRKFPNVHMTAVIDNIFQTILEKVFKDGSCSIRKFGKFFAFRTYSSRRGTNVIRFKFKMSNVLVNTISTDEYLLEHIPIQLKNKFTEKNEELCKPCRIQKTENLKAGVLTNQLAAKKTAENIMKNYVMDLIEDDTQMETK